ncbi:hypothetical protein ACFOSC_03750 [Streptantibioticus rubrisoli]|uniref:Uncharacterized protein n=1 Tax=Streptantibioticus rubrisoli TaxID=1387313 RepID=A0ABT1PLE2_9ACTN|nr:hypothetical protein [Streptantibioticus rubrisoli]MCQ4045393.1 hypothetical protein [Streptantibioticus rubrisoli]
MTAHDELHKWLTKSISTPTAERLLRDYAHELAEEIRGAATGVNGGTADFPRGMREAADLIDPCPQEEE